MHNQFTVANFTFVLFASCVVLRLIKILFEIIGLFVLHEF